MRQSTIVFAVGVALLRGPSLFAAPQPSDVRETREWEGFIDGVIEAQQKAHHFAGAVVVVVSDSA